MTAAATATPKQKRKPRRLEYEGRGWSRAVRELAYEFLIIEQCQNCGGPTVRGYRCSRCDP